MLDIGRRGGFQTRPYGEHWLHVGDTFLPILIVNNDKGASRSYANETLGTNIRVRAARDMSPYGLAGRRAKPFC